MSNSHVLCLVIAAAVVASAVLTTAYAGGDFSWIPTNNPTAACHGSVSECVDDGAGEFDTDSEINRRILATRSYISYGALKPNSVPCSRRGASYYNCRKGAQANPYKRTCSTATRCRR
ncbi:Protein RALF-like 1 [Orobanche gracilis]